MVEDVIVVVEIADVTTIEEATDALATEEIDDLAILEGDLEIEATEEVQMIQRQTDDQDLISTEINVLQNLVVLAQTDQDVHVDVIKLL